MHFGIPGTINSSVSSQGIAVMATPQKKVPQKSPDDIVWDDIFDNLVIENEPPIEYIKQVVIHTKDGHSFKVSAKHFAKIIEHEKTLNQEESEIQSCRMAINFAKLRTDVDSWAKLLFENLDGKKTRARSTRPRKAPAQKTATTTKKRTTARKKPPASAKA